MKSSVDAEQMSGWGEGEGEREGGVLWGGAEIHLPEQGQALFALGLTGGCCANIRASGEPKRLKVYFFQR